MFRALEAKNFSKTNNLVMLKHFGADNPDAARFLA